MIPFLTKYFFLIFSSNYCFSKLVCIKMKRKEHIKNLIFSLLIAPIAFFIRTNMPFFTIFFIFVSLILFARLVFQKNIYTSVRVSLLSIGISYFLFALSSVLLFPLLLITSMSTKDTQLYHTITMPVCCLLLVLLMFLLFKIPRFKKGIPDIEKKFSDGIGTFVSLMILIISSMFFEAGEKLLLPTLLLIFTLILGIIIYAWWRKYISNNYIIKSLHRTITALEDTIAHQEKEIDRLAKIIHKDNKLIPALELSVKETITNASPEKSTHLINELNFLTAERKNILHNYETSYKTLPKTGIFSTDTIINYLYKKAIDHNINFDISIIGNICYMTENIVDERDLNTLLADIGENAIIATQNVQQRNILLSIGIKNDIYYFDFFDSAPPFDPKVIENLGKRKYTTHKADGGSGIGFMTTEEFLRKYNASLEIEELTNNALFTKRVSILFDSLYEKRISSVRSELVCACRKNGKAMISLI